MSKKIWVKHTNFMTKKMKSLRSIRFRNATPKQTKMLLKQSERRQKTPSYIILCVCVYVHAILGNNNFVVSNLNITIIDKKKKRFFFSLFLNL